MTEEVHAVVGAGGGIGRATVQALLDQGRRVRSLARRPLDLPSQVDQRQVDLLDVKMSVVELGGVSVVYHCAVPPYDQWPREFPRLTRAIADAAAEVGADLVVADNLYTSPDDGRPIRESAAPVDHGPKAVTRTLVRRELLARTDLRCTFGRAADYYGPGVRGLNSIPGQAMFERAAAGRRMFWPGSLQQPHVLHYLPDLAIALTMLATSDTSWGRAWNLPSPPPLTGWEYAAAAAGGRPRVTGLPRPVMRAAGIFDAQVREALEIFWQFDRPFLVDASAFAQEIGAIAVEPHEVTVARTVSERRLELKR